MAKIWKGGATSHVLDGAVYDARVEAEHIVAVAHAQARDIIAGAEQVCETARQEGLVRGKEEGMASVAEHLVAAQVLITRKESEALPELLHLAVAMTQKIVKAELTLRPEVVGGIARAVLEKARECRSLVLRMHPEDAAMLENVRGALVATLCAEAQLRVVGDAYLARGDCVLDTEIGSIDACVETQLLALERALGVVR